MRRHLTVAPPAPAGERVRELYRGGIRSVALDEPISLRSPEPRDLHALDFVRVATARGLLVRWHLRTGRRADPELVARDLTHLQPPASLDGRGSQERLREWHRRFYIGRCVWRRGPGFVQIRDRRDGVLQLFDLSEDDYVRAVLQLEQQRAAEVDPQVLDAMRDERLVLRLGDLDWWAPALIDRWPVPSMVL
ncbi:DUF5825 family protein [Actinoplanes teichomyceticus]|uniref:Uncharacterized protein n=1 Tax=Actinoplanes teichomyceticus TaxID=1867 RepID=A0A561VLP6_ACTTI|nr:DUF5825 family protein [Actinoplanes teichomyceticus]TWG12534.1 hypothetical protein FHX34_105401 [Actinoplanes teichomyceticus]GIF13899.1 hypothetical protein Ate01nite_39310 [Actinoplanes teichomyceticus]